MGGIALGGQRVTAEVGWNVAQKALMMLEGAISAHIVCGSLRRGKPDVGDVDIVVIGTEVTPIRLGDLCGFHKNGNPKKKMLVDEVQVDINVATPEDWGSQILMWTGSKAFNIRCRTKAIGMGYTLNQYGLFDGEKRIAGATEEDVLKALKMKWVEPKDRD